MGALKRPPSLAQGAGQGGRPRPRAAWLPRAGQGAPSPQGGMAAEHEPGAPPRPRAASLPRASQEGALGPGRHRCSARGADPRHNSQGGNSRDARAATGARTKEPRNRKEKQGRSEAQRQQRNGMPNKKAGTRPKGKKAARNRRTNFRNARAASRGVQGARRKDKRS